MPVPIEPSKHCGGQGDPSEGLSSRLVRRQQTDSACGQLVNGTWDLSSLPSSS